PWVERLNSKPPLHGGRASVGVLVRRRVLLRFDPRSSRRGFPPGRLIPIYTAVGALAVTCNAGANNLMQKRSKGRRPRVLRGEYKALEQAIDFAACSRYVLAHARPSRPAYLSPARPRTSRHDRCNLPVWPYRRVLAWCAAATASLAIDAASLRS